MNYYDARPLADRSGYHYTARNDDRIFPVGYCAEYREDKAHVHGTEEEARECFRRYLLDGQREQEYGDWAGCEVCDTPTKKGLTTRPPLGAGHALCDEHRTSEQLAELTPVPGQIIASY